MPHATNTPVPSTPPTIGQLCEVRCSPGKGRGLFAKQDLPKGTLIMADKPVAITPKMSQDLTLTDVKRALQTLTPAQRAQFMDLTSAGGTSDHHLVKIYQTNGHGYSPSGNGGCMCLNMAYINHSCLNNAQWQYLEATDTWIVNAEKDIAKDAEITVGYVHFLRYYSRAQRQEITKEVWGFECACELCSLPVGSSKAMVSDMRRVLLLGLRLILEGRNGTLPLLEMMEFAFRGSGGRSLCEVKYWVPAMYTDADRTFAWWIVAKLHEAEGFEGQGVGDGYACAVWSLMQRMEAVGVKGKCLNNADAWFANVKEWWRIAGDTSVVTAKSEGSLAYMPEGQKPWKQLADGSLCVSEYDRNGVVMKKKYRRGELQDIENRYNPGEKFCRDYMRKYGHLYR